MPRTKATTVPRARAASSAAARRVRPAEAAPPRRAGIDAAARAGGPAGAVAPAAAAAQSPADAPRALAKGQQTRAVIAQAALRLAAQVGLEGLSIGSVAAATAMSKSGVFAHFGSREELQIAVVREYVARFEQEVFAGALSAERGLPRLAALFARWMRLASDELDSGCIFISGAVEYDDRPGAVRQALVEAVGTWMLAIERAVAQAQAAGHLAPGADARQIGFEMHALILALHYDARFLQRPGAVARAERGFESIVARYAAPAVSMPNHPPAPAE